MGFLAGGVGTVVAAGAIAGVVVAQSGGDSPAAERRASAATTSNTSESMSQLAKSLGVSSGSLQSALTQTAPNGDGFIERLAAKLGIDPQVLRDAIKATGGDIIDEAAADGSISEAMAERLRSLLDEGDLFDLDRLGDIARGFIDRHFSGHEGGAGLFGMRAETFTAVAGYLGMREDDLRSALEDGKTLAEIGEEHGKSRADLEAFLERLAIENIDQALANGEVDEDEADRRKAAVPELVDRILDSSFDAKPFGGMFRGGGGLPFGFGALPGIFGAFTSGFSDVAGFLGISEDQLKDELNSGKSPAEIAEAHGKTREEFQSFLESEASQAIQDLQDSGKITADQAGDFREHANDAIEHFMDASIRIHESSGGPGRWISPGDQPRTEPSGPSGSGQTY